MHGQDARCEKPWYGPPGALSKILFHARNTPIRPDSNRLQIPVTTSFSIGQIGGTVQATFFKRLHPILASKGTDISRLSIWQIQPPLPTKPTRRLLREAFSFLVCINSAEGLPRPFWNPPEAAPKRPEYSLGERFGLVS